MFNILLKSAIAAGSSLGPDNGGVSNTFVINPPAGAPTTVCQLINSITTGLLYIVAPIASLIIIYGAFLILTAAGSPERYESGKKTVLYAIVGLVIVVIAKGLVLVVTQLFGGTAGSCV